MTFRRLSKKPKIGPALNNLARATFPNLGYSSPLHNPPLALLVQFPWTLTHSPSKLLHSKCNFKHFPHPTLLPPHLPHLHLHLSLQLSTRLTNLLLPAPKTTTTPPAPPASVVGAPITFSVTAGRGTTRMGSYWTGGAGFRGVARTKAGARVKALIAPTGGSLRGSSSFGGCRSTALGL